MQLTTIDILIFIAYVVGLVGLALWVSREKAGHQKNTQDYFLAGKSLPWYAVGASLIAANISAEQIIGMSGSGYVIGLGIASYEWMAAITLIIVGKYFVPVFIKREIYTMPQFLQQRYDNRVRTLMAIFWLGVYVFVNLTSILWLGTLAIHTVTGFDLVHGMIFLGVFAASYSLYGGLKAVALTDIIQVILLLGGGLFLTYTVLNEISHEGGAWQGFILLTQLAPEKFDLILSPDNPHYISLPGISVLVGGMWIMNLSYWGFNQYIIQRTLAAKSIQEGQKGIAMAAFIKLLMPIIVVLPGIAAAILSPDLDKPDQAYPTLMQLMPTGIKGLVFAALIAAIVSSLGSMMNSISTIFTMDIYSSFYKNRSERHYVVIGRTASFTALLLALICAKPLLGNFDQAFQYIQEFTGFFTPGIVVLFLLGVFWKRATSNSALVTAAGSAVLSFSLKLLWPELPFIDRVGLVFIMCLTLAVITSFTFPDKEENKRVDLKDINLSTQPSYNWSAIAVIAILCALYTTWW